MTATAPIFVVGASGELGGEVVRALRDRGAPVRVLVHATPPSGLDAEPVTGDLLDRPSLDRALAGVRAAFFVTPHHAEEARAGRTFVEACEAAGLERLVFASAFHPWTGWRPAQRLLDGVVGLIGPHYRTKFAVERRVRASPLSPVVLGPSNFFQNDELARPELVAGSFPHPAGRRAVNRVDTRDVGDAAARALLDPDVASGVYPLVGPTNWTTEACAALWAEALGRPVGYAGDDIEAWRRTIGARMPDAKAADFARTYGILQRFGAPAGKRVRDRTQALLGRPARTYEAYVHELAARWTSTP